MHCRSGFSRDHKLPLVLNFVASQAVWFLSLYGAGTGRPWLGGVALLVFATAQLRLSQLPRKELLLALLAAACGLVLDTGYVRAGLISYAQPVPSPAVAPYWIVLMWANFGLTLDSCLRWLQRRLLLAAVCGAVGGPLAYEAGVRLGAATVTASPALVYGVLAVAWGSAVPLLLAVAARLSRHPGNRPGPVSG